MYSVLLVQMYTVFTSIVYLQLVFEATTRSYYRNDYSSSHINKLVYDAYGFISFDDVYVYNTSCSCKLTLDPCHSE